MKLADIMADMKGEMGQEWEKKGFQMPKFDIGALKARTHKAPVWVHFGAGNLFRAFPAAVLQNVLDTGFWTPEHMTGASLWRKDLISRLSTKRIGPMTI